jgi:outer membrane immunogenic protein
MNRSLVASIALLVVIGGPAMAADLKPVYKAPVYKAPVDPGWNWTGFYLGGNGGYSWGRGSTDFTESSTVTSVLTNTTAAGTPLVGNGTTAITTTSIGGSSTANMNGWLGGGQIGYNWQYDRRWVFGLEADIQGTGQRGDITFCGTAGCPTGSQFGTASLKLPWFATFRGRLGVTMDRVFLYGTGGLAVGNVKADYTSGLIGGPLSTFSANTTRVGWVLGVGGETFLDRHWTFKIEYLYMDLGNVDAALASTGTVVTPILINSDFNRFITTTTANTAAFHTHVTDNILRAGINYKFDPDPIVARY